MKNILFLAFFDADGSFVAYRGAYGQKMNITFGGSESLLHFIESHLTTNEIILKADTGSGQRKLHQRHEGKDGTWRTLNFAGKQQCMKIINYLYKDSPIYLDRKYQKYLDLPYHN